MIKVLFLCAANICRSPAAEGIFNFRIKERGLADQFDVASAGLYATEGRPPHTLTQATAKNYGIDLSSYRSSYFEPAEAGDYDYIIALDRAILDKAVAGAPAGSKARFHLLLSYVPALHKLDVPDPFIGDDGFEEVHKLIDQGIDGLLAELVKTHGLKPKV